jgi:hypothetical protein
MTLSGQKALLSAFCNGPQKLLVRVPIIVEQFAA